MIKNCSVVTCISTYNRNIIVYNIDEKGRLRLHANYWCNVLEASDFIFDVVKNSNVIPFNNIPQSYFMKNNKSAFDHSDFVTDAVADLVKSGCVLEVPFQPF
jgi:hypothetical protein